MVAVEIVRVSNAYQIALVQQLPQQEVHAQMVAAEIAMARVHPIALVRPLLQLVQRAQMAVMGHVRVRSQYSTIVLPRHACQFLMELDVLLVDVLVVEVVDVHLHVFCPRFVIQLPRYVEFRQMVLVPGTVNVAADKNA
jgi:hypothetical protein